jgi:putative two-component system response regulator
MANERVLIVEDNDLLREGLHEMLAYEGFTVVTARNGSEALDRMIQLLPELIVSDVAMPVMDGYEFYNQIRSRPEWVTIPFLFLSARTEASDILASRNLGVDDYLTKPISREELVSVIRSRIDRYRQIQIAQIQQAYQASLTALANAIEMRSPDSSRHVERVTEIALVLAKRLGWREGRLAALRFGAILHDIGKIHIPTSILVKQGPLDPAEIEEVRRHPVTGAEMIKGVPMLGGAGLIVRHHHERWDGKGYPDGLAGIAIPEGARILAVADAFIVMISPQPYSTAQPPKEACKEILALSGKNYDPKVVEIFKHAWEAGEIQAILTKH